MPQKISLKLNSGIELLRSPRNDGNQEKSCT